MHGATAAPPPSAGGGIHTNGLQFMLTVDRGTAAVPGGPRRGVLKLRPYFSAGMASVAGGRGVPLSSFSARSAECAPPLAHSLLEPEAR